MKLNFKISEFNISGKAIPEDIADKILKEHIEPMQYIRDLLNIPIFPSSKSGYRSKAWELSRGRSGTSQHTFEGKGAVDWVCSNFIENKAEFLDLIIEYTNYTRITVYNNFLHCDYKNDIDDRALYSSDNLSNWNFIKNV